MTPPKRATIRDVAQSCGVSTATVSHVLNNRADRVSAEVRAQVLQAIRALRYQPKAVFRGPHAERADTIGIVYQLDRGDSLFDHPYGLYVLDGILSVAKPRQIHLTLFTTEQWADAPRHLRSYLDGRCDGLLLLAPATDNPLRGALRERGFPFVAVNAGMSDPDTSSVDVDNARAAEEMTDHLIRTGHRRIAFLGGNEELENAAERRAGYLSALRRAGVEPRPEWIVPGRFWHRSGLERARPLLAQEPGRRPTAFFCCNDQIARGVYEAARERGLSVPDDVSVTGFDDLPVAASLDPPLTTVRQPFQRMGAVATEILFGRVYDAPPADDTPEVVKRVLPFERIDRGSVAPPPAEP